MPRSREISSESSRSSRKGSRSVSKSSSPGRRSSYEKGRRSEHKCSRRRSPSSPSNYHGKFDNPEPCKCLGVFGLSLRTDERDLSDIFRRCGSVENVTVVYDRRSGRSRGFGFIKFKHQRDADVARRDLNGTDIDGRHIRVDYSVTKRPHSPTPGVYMGKVDDRYRRSPPYDNGRDYERRSSYRRRSPRSRSYERRR